MKNQIMNKEQVKNQITAFFEEIRIPFHVNFYNDVSVTLDTRITTFEMLGFNTFRIDTYDGKVFGIYNEEKEVTLYNGGKKVTFNGEFKFMATPEKITLYFNLE